jgi:hypothetical protein
MKILQGFNVKCFFINGSVLQGEVLQWEENEIYLKSSKNGEKILIHNPKRDLFATIVLDKSLEDEASENVIPSIDFLKENPRAVLDKFEEVKQEPLEENQMELILNQSSNDQSKSLNDQSKSLDDIMHLKAKNIAEVKKEMISQEKEIIAQKLKTHYSSPVGPTKYGYPSFLKKGK